jgi:hypothetical protein
MFSIGAEDFLIIPLSFGFNLQSRFSCFCMFLYFQGPPGLQKDPIFFHVIFWEIEDREKKKSTGNATRWKKASNTCQEPGPCGGAHLPLVGPTATNFGSTDLS